MDYTTKTLRMDTEANSKLVNWDKVKEKGLSDFQVKLLLVLPLEEGHLSPVTDMVDVLRYLYPDEDINLEDSFKELDRLKIYCKEKILRYNIGYRLTKKGRALLIYILDGHGTDYI